MNINIPGDSREWLFAEPADPNNGRLWSMGRYPPPVKAGDEILFRFDGDVVASAICHEVYKPGLFNTISHNGARDLRGYKCTWLNSTFVDLRRRFTASFACNEPANGAFLGDVPGFACGHGRSAEGEQSDRGG